MGHPWSDLLSACFLDLFWGVELYELLLLIVLDFAAVEVNHSYFLLVSFLGREVAFEGVLGESSLHCFDVLIINNAKFKTRMAIDINMFDIA